MSPEERAGGKNREKGGKILNDGRVEGMNREKERRDGKWTEKERKRKYKRERKRLGEKRIRDRWMMPKEIEVEMRKR